MKKHLRNLTILVLLFSFAPIVQSAEETVADHAVLNASIMRPDPATWARWYREYLNAPKSHIDPGIARRLATKAPEPVPLLLDHILYRPVKRNQSSCGNCWVWAGTALMETKHSIETGVKDRLSIQWFDSKFYTMPGGYYACEGGNLETFVSFYNKPYRYIPWVNDKAWFQDYNGGDEPHVEASSIATEPYYLGSTNALVAATIPTTDVSQATAIANIKNVLNQNKAVYFGFSLATQADWNAFFDFWNNQSEATVWDPDSFCGHTEDGGQGGHAVVIVGYDDTASSVNDHYWIVLNSWGAPSGRPNGLFRMKMYMSYGCKCFTQSNEYYWARRFRNIETAAGKSPFFGYNWLYMAAKGASTNYIWTRRRMTSGSWSAWSMMDGTTSETPAMATFLTRLHMVTKGATDNSLSYRWVDTSGEWSEWKSLTGSTDAAPALVTYRDRLYLFVKQAGSNSISYKYRGESPFWTTWQTVPGSSTPYAPAVVAYNDKLTVFQTGLDGKVYFNSMNRDESWSGWGGLYWDASAMITNAAPAAAVFDNRVHVVVKGLAGTPNSNRISLIATPGDLGSWYQWAQIPGNGLAGGAPRMGAGPDVNTLTVTVKGQSSNTMWSQTYKKGTGWNSSWDKMTGYSTSAPSLNTYWFGIDDPHPMSPRLGDHPEPH